MNVDNQLVVSENSKIVSWSHGKNIVKKKFSKPIFQGVYVKFLDLIIIIADYREVGSNNIFVYNMKGSIKFNPNMPDKRFKIYGAYSMWYIENNIEQDVVLLTNDNKNYEIKCKYNLLHNTFSNFSLTK